MAEKSIGEEPVLLIDPKQPLLPEIGRELCRVRNSDVKDKQGSGKAHVIRTDFHAIAMNPFATESTSDSGEFRGYRRNILTENLSERESTLLLCNRCKGIMREACISTNGEQFCECCRNSKQSYNLYRSNEQTIPNTHVRNTVLSLKCSCPLQERGCEWLGTLGECENHLDVCSHVHEKCKLSCGIVLPRHELEMHVNTKCVQRKIPCKHCKRNFKVCDMPDHINECPKMLLKCELKCGTVVCRGEMAQHLKKDCRRVLEHCKLGCGIELPRYELDIHVNEKCVHRKIRCEHCHIDFKVYNMLTHHAKCPYFPLQCVKRCGTTVEREKMAQHLKKDCCRVIEECKLGCGIKLPRDDLKMHVNEYCVQRVIPCEYCYIDFKAWGMSNHNKKCQKMPISCELGCDILVCREDKDRHLEEECVEKKVECPFIKYKCEVGLIKRKELNQHLKEKRTEHTELKFSTLEEIVMQQSKMISKQNEMIAKQNGQFKTLFSIINTTKLEWRIQNVGNSMTDYNYSTFQQFLVDRFNFTLELYYRTINIHYPRQELSKVKVKFIFRIIGPSNPDVTWEGKSNIIEIKQKGSDINAIAIIPPREEFKRDNGIDLEILVTFL